MKGLQLGSFDQSRDGSDALVEPLETLFGEC